MMMMTTNQPANQNDQPQSPRRWVTLCQLDDIMPGRAKYVEFEDRAYSVVRRPSHNSDDQVTGEEKRDGGEMWGGEGEVQIFADACPHAGASMSYGCVKDGCFICPVHQWAFRMTDGRNPESPEIILQTYPCRVKNGAVQIGIRH